MSNLAVRALVNFGAAAALAVLAIQLVPAGEASNPPVLSEPAWDSPRTRELAQRACFDCHSNETKWPWYASVAPISWSVRHHVQEGREVLNFSEWNRSYEEAHESAEELAEGEMPLPGYVALHPEARLTDAERRELIAGLQATLGGEGGEGGEGDEGHERGAGYDDDDDDRGEHHARHDDDDDDDD